jgi:hypothetical protein
MCIPDFGHLPNSFFVQIIQQSVVPSHPVQCARLLLLLSSHNAHKGEASFLSLKFYFPLFLFKLLTQILSWYLCVHLLYHCWHSCVHLLYHCWHSFGAWHQGLNSVQSTFDLSPSYWTPNIYQEMNGTKASESVFLQTQSAALLLAVSCCKHTPYRQNRYDMRECLMMPSSFSCQMLKSSSRLKTWRKGKDICSQDEVR